MFTAAAWIEADPVYTITVQELKECIVQRCPSQIDGENAPLVEEVVRKVQIKVHIFDTKDRIWSFDRDYLHAIKSAGLEKDSRTKAAYSHKPRHDENQTIGVKKAIEKSVDMKRMRSSMGRTIINSWRCRKACNGATGGTIWEMKMMKVGSIEKLE